MYANETTKFHDDRFRHLSNITVITATILGDVMLVLVIKGISEGRHLRWLHVASYAYICLSLCLGRS
jgi:hypothetical protein